MPTQQIDCGKYADQCEKLKQVLLNGVSNADLQRLGIARGSVRAKELEDALIDICLRCCARFFGPETPPPPLPPPPPPGTLPPIAIGATLAPTLARPGVLTAIEELLADTVAAAKNIHPLVWVVIVAAFIAASGATQVCPHIKTRIMPDGSKECIYKCPNGTLYYSYEFFGGLCLPFVVKAV